MQNEEVLVSVICTAYNHEKFIRSALDGFVMQKTNFRYEVLIHDDASTDNTAKIITEYAQKYPDIFVPVLQTENQYSKGVRVGNTFLMPKAKGKYIAFCEGDDCWTDENKLQLQVDFLETHPDYVACVHNTLIDNILENRSDGLFVQQTEEHDVTFEQTIWGMGTAYQTSSLILRRKYCFELPDFYQLAVSFGFGDWPRAIYLTLSGKVRFLPGVMSTYRRMSGPNCWSIRNTGVQKQIRVMENSVMMLEAVKKHLTPEQAELADEVIADKTFTKLLLQEDYAALKDPQFDKVWQKMPTKQKLKICVKMYLPWLYTLKRKLGK